MNEKLFLKVYWRTKSKRVMNDNAMFNSREEGKSQFDRGCVRKVERWSGQVERGWQE